MPEYATDEHMLKTLRDGLYGGSWERMLEDLRKRREGRPFIPKMHLRIEADMAKIEEIMARPKSGKPAGAR